MKHKKIILLSIIILASFFKPQLQAIDTSNNNDYCPCCSCCNECDSTCSQFKLFQACSNGTLDEVKNLVENGARESVCKADNNGRTTVLWACEKNNLEMLKYLCENEATTIINQADNEGATPLFVALYFCDQEIVKYLIENGAINNTEITSINRACCKNNLTFLKKTINNLQTKKFTKEQIAEQINKADKLGNTPILWACGNNNFEMVKYLIANGAKKTINTANICNNTPIEYACSNNNFEMVKYLCENCATESINISEADGTTTVYEACQNNNLIMLKYLIEKGANKEYLNKVGFLNHTPLYFACNNNNLEMVKYIFKNCAAVKKSLNITYELEETMLDVACKNNNLEMVKFLVENGCREMQVHWFCDKKIIDYLHEKNIYTGPIF